MVLDATPTTPHITNVFDTDGVGRHFCLLLITALTRLLGRYL